MLTAIHLHTWPLFIAVNGVAVKSLTTNFGSGFVEEIDGIIR